MTSRRLLVLIMVFFCSASPLTAEESLDKFAERMAIETGLIVPLGRPGLDEPADGFRKNRKKAGMVDPTDDALPSPLRKLARAAASLGYDNGRFVVSVNGDFVMAQVKNDAHKNTEYHTYSMRDALKEYGVQTQLVPGGEWYLDVPPYRDSLLRHLRQSGIPSSKIIWRSFDHTRDQAGEGRCSMWLVSDNLLFTNNHCISSEELCRVSSVRFNEESGGAVDAFPCKRLVLTDEALDFSIVEVEGSPGIKYGHMMLTARGPDKGGQYYIIGHPAGHGDVTPSSHVSLKMVSGPCSARPRYIPKFNIDLARLLQQHEFDLTGNANNSVFSLSCPLFGGSSGSAVVDERFKVSGILNRGNGFGSDSFGVSMADIIGKYGGQLQEMGIEIH